MAIRMSLFILLFCGCSSDVSIHEYKQIKGWADYHPEIAVEFAKMYEDKQISTREYIKLRRMNSELTRQREAQSIIDNRQREAQSVIDNIKAEQND